MLERLDPVEGYRTLTLFICALVALAFCGCSDPSGDSQSPSGEDAGHQDVSDTGGHDVSDSGGEDVSDAGTPDTADAEMPDAYDGGPEPTLTDYRSCTADADCTGAAANCLTEVPLNRAAQDGRTSVALSEVFPGLDPGDGVCTRACSDAAAACDDMSADGAARATCQMVFSDVAPYPAEPPAFPFAEQLDSDALAAGMVFGAICRPPLELNPGSSRVVCESCASSDDCGEGAICWGPTSGSTDNGGAGHCLPECSSDADCATGLLCQAPSGEGSSVCVPIEGTCTDCRDVDKDGVGVGRCGANGGVTAYDCDDTNPDAYYDPENSLHAFPDYCGEHDYNCNGLSDAAEQIGPQAFGSEHCTACGDSCGGSVANGQRTCSRVVDADGAAMPACTVACETDANGDALFADCNGPAAGDGCETAVDDPDALVFLDADQDGYGDPQSPLFQCPGETVPDNYVANGDDCDDTTGARAPGLEEMCDGLDNNCDGIVDNKPFSPVSNPASTPPFSGTAFITDDLIKDTDPTAFAGLTYTGQGTRTMYDRRTASWRTLNAYLFDAQFGTSTTVEVQVNPEFTQTEAEAEAQYYADVIGRLPAFMFRELDTVWIHKGQEPFGGGNDNLLIHTEQGDIYAANGELEEIMLHEAAHTSLDPHYFTSRWSQAAAADGVALSTYAAANPTREDIAESIGPYLAARFRPGRVSAQTITTISNTIPNRMQFFDCQGLTMDIVQ